MDTITLSRSSLLNRISENKAKVIDGDAKYDKHVVAEIYNIVTERFNTFRIFIVG